MKKGWLLYFKGILMGICDLIPGISGGTIAFITGIYPRLMNSVQSFSPKLLINYLRYVFLKEKSKVDELKQDIKKLDLKFLFILLFGIITSLLVGSRLIIYLLENYTAYFLCFFIGLVFASSKLIYDDIIHHNKKNILIGFFGILFGILILFLKIKPSFSYTYIFFGGFIGISAMFLPGISGSFILLIMGIYEFMLNVLKNLSNNINYFIVFSCGAVLGAFSISRLINFLFKKDKCKTLYFLLGLVVGSLSIPIERVYKAADFSFLNTIIMTIFFLIGFLLVYFLSKYSLSKKDKLIGL